MGRRHAATVVDDLARLHGVSSISAEPPRIFNPAAYIADLRAAGLDLHPAPIRETDAITGRDGRGIGAAHGDVQAKWARAMDEDVDPVGRMYHALMTEA